MDDPPIEIPVEWDKYVNEPLTEKELERLWQSVNPVRYCVIVSNVTLSVI